jgi:hypothetical protein
VERDPRHEDHHAIAATSYSDHVPVPDRVEIVQFSGGEHHGLVVEAPAALAARLPRMRFTVTAAGQLFDLEEQCRLREARVITRPGATRPTPAPARTPTPAAEPAPEPPVLVAAPVPAARRPTVALPQFLSPAARPRP